MRRFLLVIAVLLCWAVADAQPIQTQKSTFVPKEDNVFHLNQAVATNTRTGMTLVVWEKATANSREIFGRLVNARGVPASARFTLVANTVASHPFVIYNPVRNEFLLAYDDNPQPQLVRSDIYVMRLNSQGRSAGAAAKVSTDAISSTMSNFFPRFVFNSQTSSYVLLWLREIANSGQAGQGNNGLVGTQLTGGGSLNGPVVLLQNTVIEGNRLWQPAPQDATIHPNNGKLLISMAQVQSGTNGGQANYTLGTVNADLGGITAANFERINSTPVILSAGFVLGTKIAFTTNTTGVLYFVDSGNIRRRKIDAAGKVSGSATTAFRPPKNNTKLLYPSVAFNTVGSVRRGLLIALENLFSETGAAVVWGQPLDATGAPLGAPVKLDTTASNETAITSQMIALPPVTGVPGFRFAALYTVIQFTSPGQTFQRSGIVKLNLTIPSQ